MKNQGLAALLEAGVRLDGHDQHVEPDHGDAQHPESPAGAEQWRFVTLADCSIVWATCLPSWPASPEIRTTRAKYADFLTFGFRTRQERQRLCSIIGQGQLVRNQLCTISRHRSSDSRMLSLNQGAELTALPGASTRG